MFISYEMVNLFCGIVIREGLLQDSKGERLVLLGYLFGSIHVRELDTGERTSRPLFPRGAGGPAMTNTPQLST